MTRRLLLLAALACGAPAALAAQGARVGDLTVKAGDVPRRLVGYGLVLGLDGTGDRSFGGLAGETPTVRSIINLLRRFDIQVPPVGLQSRNVAAVLVTAEASPWLRSGGRFEVQVSSIGDAVSLKGGVLFTTPLMADPNQPPVATAQGPLLLLGDDPGGSRGGIARRGTSARIPDGGVLEVDPAEIAAAEPVLRLRRPDLLTATRVAAAVNAALGAGTATVQDPGSIALTPKGPGADNLIGLLAAIDTLPVAAPVASRVVISSRDGSVVAGGDVRVGPAAVSHRGLTLSIGTAAPPAPGDSTRRGQGLLALASGATVQDVAAGLHAAGATSQEVAAIFAALVDVGALSAQVTVR